MDQIWAKMRSITCATMSLKCVKVVLSKMGMGMKLKIHMPKIDLLEESATEKK